MVIIKSKEIINISDNIKEYFIKNKKYPQSVKINGRSYTIQEATYLMCSFVENPNKDVELVKVGGASKPSGDRCNRKVLKSVYTDMSKRCKKYIEEEKRLPNYVVITDNHKCSIILWIYQLSKIVSAYNGELPKNILINSADLEEKPAYKKYGRSTATGCDNRGQNNAYFCGPHMAQEIIRNLTGKVIPQSTIAGVMGTTSSGTSHQGINTFFAWFNKNYRYNLEVDWKNFSEVGWNGIKKILESDNQDCGLHESYKRTPNFEGFGHYTNFDKVYENSVDVHNSLGNTCERGCYCGHTENRSKSTAKYYLDGISQKSVLIVTRK